MSWKPTDPQARIKQNEATIRAYAKEVEKLKTELLNLRLKLAGMGLK